MLKAALSTRPKILRRAPVQEIVTEAPDLTSLPVQTCWPGDAGPLITWPVVLTRPHGSEASAVGRYNAGVYRAQVLGKDQLILRWLAHRGGALDFREHKRAHPGQPFPVSVVLGCDPATILGAVTPVPDTLSEYQFAGLLRGSRTEGNQRRYAKETLRRVAFIRIAQGVGLSLDDVRAALATLPEQRTPTPADWARLSRAWKPLIEARIASLAALRDQLDSCIGCGCLSLTDCPLRNGEDRLGTQGPGPRVLITDAERRQRRKRQG